MLTKLAGFIKNKKLRLKGISCVIIMGVMLLFTPIVSFAADDETTTTITDVDSLLEKMDQAPTSNNLAPVTNMATDTGLEALTFLKLVAIIILAGAMVIAFVKFGAAGNQNTVGDGKSGLVRAFLAVLGVLCLLGIIGLGADLSKNMFKTEEKSGSSSSIVITYEMDA